MKKDGVIAMTVQPFMKAATNETAKKLGSEISTEMRKAGYSDIKMELKYMKPLTTVCVLGVNR